MVAVLADGPARHCGHCLVIEAPPARRRLVPHMRDCAQALLFDSCRDMVWQSTWRQNTIKAKEQGCIKALLPET